MVAGDRCGQMAHIRNVGMKTQLSDAVCVYTDRKSSIRTAGSEGKSHRC